MNITYSKYPYDIIFCILWSLILLPIILFDVNSTLRIIMGLPFILFIPGYSLLFALFPKKQIRKQKDKDDIDLLDRIAFSIGLSMAVVPLIGIALFYLVGKFQLEYILLGLILYIISISVFGIYRWMKTDPSERFILTINLRMPKPENKTDKILYSIIIILLILLLATVTYIILNPKPGETNTEFYILGPGRKTADYPGNLSVGENASVFLGIVNHEQQTMEYSVEIWLLNQTFEYNQTTQQNETIYHNFWFMDNYTVTLDHFEHNDTIIWGPQWETEYTFSIEQKGHFTLTFLLYTTPTEEYVQGDDYIQQAEQKLQNAYQSLHLWIQVS